MAHRTSRLIIVEGPDGTGKTTLAKQLCQEFHALYVHLGPLKHVSSGLARIYHEAMAPALGGYSNVVMDRAWHSELPYGEVFRNGQDRLGAISRRMLERTAMRCGAVVIYCATNIETAANTFTGRADDEYLDTVDELRQVTAVYERTLASQTALPVFRYDYQSGVDMGRTLDTFFLENILSWTGVMPHSTGAKSAGNINASILLVGSSFADLKNDDPLDQYPFVSYSPVGCSQWLTQQLADGGISESELCWVNADQDLDLVLSDMHNLRLIVAMGNEAKTALVKCRRHDFLEVAHPQHHKRFTSAGKYPLIKIIQEQLGA